MNLLRRILKRIFGSVFLATVTFVGAPVAFGVTILAGLIFLPLPATIPLPKAAATVQPTIIFDREGVPIATLQGFEQDLPFTASQVPAILKEAIVADEDRNYYHESGVDVRGMLRALYADVRNEATVQGGSTITQQYVKLAYVGSQRTLVRKVKEAILAGQLAREASKDEILYHYMTLIYLGDGQTGVESASETFFHVPVQRLNPSQAATISGLIPAPSSRAPEENLPVAEAARELVLKEMYQQHYLTQAQYEHWLAMKLAVFGTAQAVPGKATIVYPKVVLTNTIYPDFVNYVEDWMDTNLPASVIQAGGLRIQTTMDPTIEQDALNAVDSTLTGSSYPVDMALAAVEPSTGFVDAITGGRGYSLGGANLALEGCPKRSSLGIGATQAVPVPPSCWTSPMVQGCQCNGMQPGSSYKPFTLATAFEQHIPPSTQIPAPYIYKIPPTDGSCIVKPGNTCTIKNDSVTSGSQNLATAIADSTNTVFAQLAERVGCPNVANTAKAMGLQTAFYATPPIFTCAAYSLGEIDVNPLDMASAYGVFADHGQRATPTPILEIVNAQDKVLVDNIHHQPKTSQVIPTNVADNVTNVLQGVLQFGTAAGRGIGRPAAGKTGTTSNYANAWFVGYTPTMSTAVWMGNINGDEPIGYSSGCPQGCVTGHLLGGQAETFDGIFGADWPAITWQEYMKTALAKVPVTNFSAPAPIFTPQEAAALEGPNTSTTVPIEPGPAGQPAQTPSGGPYVYPANPPVAPPPTTAPGPTTTTLPGETTTTFGFGTTTTTTAGGPPPFNDSG